MLVLALVRLGGGQAYRTLAACWRVPHVTLHRWTARVCAVLAGIPLPPSDRPVYEVDTTVVRVRRCAGGHYSGYKHHHGRKVQVVADDRGRVVDVAPSCPASAHDKTLWDRKAARLRQDRPVLGDKAYAGGGGEGSMLFRPVKRNETAWRTDEAACRRSDFALSKIRVRIYNVFARLKTFRVLRVFFPFRVGLVDTVFRALAVVQNLIVETSADTASA